jgi:hypothetical protein
MDPGQARNSLTAGAGAAYGLDLLGIELGPRATGVGRWRHDT